MEPRFLGVIPARMNSTRFHGKPLKEILGKPMIQWVYENSKQTKNLADLIVATDSQEIYDTVISFNGKAILTDTGHLTGLDRVMEVSEKLSDFTHYINIQGDEPAIHPETIDGVITTMRHRENCQIASAAIAFSDYKNFVNPNQVKVVFDQNRKAMYFSRSPIPYREATNCEGAYKHLGIYGYRKEALKIIKKLRPGILESYEKLEQLRIMESGLDIYLYLTSHDSIGVDTPDDIRVAENILKQSTAISAP